MLLACVANDGGTIKHRITASVVKDDPSETASAVSGQSPTFNTTSCLDEATGFNAGVGIEAGKPSFIIVNTANQAGIEAMRFKLQWVINTTGNVVEFAPHVRETAVGGTTRRWAAIRLFDEVGGPFYVSVPRTSQTASGSSSTSGA